jgi:hypothetical protein
MQAALPRSWPSARHFTEAVQCPGLCYSDPELRSTLPAVDRLGMPLVTSGQFAYVYKLNSEGGAGRSFAVRCFRGDLGDREERYSAIHRHLNSRPIPALARFSYQPEGVLVLGKRYPIVVMDWIEGPTMDVYLDEVVNRREVVLHLANEWLKLVKTLHDAEIAHGDLQHGNIIVERGMLRLVDLDGMFVPEMAGWHASELGHQHFQHPSRVSTFFNATLDNFSSLAIYLSLIAMAERPDLWARYHDENLLFTKSDFLDPANSAVFREVMELGVEHKRLCELLMLAAAHAPEATPYLLDIAEIKSGRPSWLSDTEGIEVHGKTREAVPAVRPSQGRRAHDWGQWNGSRKGGTTTAQRANQGIAHGAGAHQVAVPPPEGLAEISKAALKHAKNAVGRGFLFWYWGIYAVMGILGISYSIPFVIFLLAFFTLVYGFMRAYRESKYGAVVQPLFPPGTNAMGARSPASMRPAVNRIAATAPLPPAQPINVSPIVGNRALGIYHLESCTWASKISAQNRVQFSSRSSALSAAYRPCKVCAP